MSENTQRVSFRSDTNRRQSLDRFGDDLCEVLLSFLSLEDRFRCQCVSKQWQRVVYNTQTELLFKCRKLVSFSAKINDKTFEWILRKCANITRIECPYDGFVINDSKLDSITKYCDHLNAFDVNID